MYKRILYLFSFLFIFFNNVNCYGENVNLPLKVDLLNREQATYLSPENTLAARHSALLNGILDWADETMTKQSLDEEIADYKMAGIDRTKLFELERTVKEMYIVNKLIHKNGIILIIEAFGYDGSIQRVPFAFEIENGLWKFTNKFAEDEITLNNVYYVPPLFNGKGQSPDDVNSFLGYEQPSQAQTELPAGTATYTVHVYFGKTINPTTFTAELHKNDLRQKFSPKPFTDEEVEIPLQKGRNVLVLSVDGIRKDGRKATDTDRLVFIVP